MSEIELLEIGVDVRSAVELDSLVAPGRLVRVHPYGPNPLLEETFVLFPGLARLASTIGPAPRMFTAGEEDLPAFTASGIDPPMLLLRLPYRVRHHVAAIASRDQVLNDVFPRYAGDPRGHVDHEKLREAVARIRSWVDRAAATRTHTDTAPLEDR